jgi:hypothetical protein
MKDTFSFCRFRFFGLVAAVALSILSFGQVSTRAATESARVVKYAQNDNVIIQLERRPGIRFVSEVLEIKGYDAESDRYDLSPVFSPQV